MTGQTPTVHEVRRPFATRDDCAKLRAEIEAQKLGRFNNDNLDDPLPHIWWSLLADLDDMETERDRLRGSVESIRAWAVKAREEYQSGEREMVGPDGPIPCRGVLNSPIAPLLHITGMCSDALAGKP